MKKIGLFIDGAYLSKLLLNNFGNMRLNFETFANWMAEDIDIYKAYYYDCLPYSSSNPTHHERQLLARKMKFFNYINDLPLFEVREGRLEYRGRRENGRRIFQQKRVDVFLAVDLVKLSYQRDITHAAILTGDSDFIPALEAAKEAGIHLKYFHGPVGSYHETIMNVIHESTEITIGIVRACSL